jgi:AraC-like DNA-binding protein
MDSSGLERVDWSAYLQLLSFVRDRVTQWSGRIRRHAVVVRPGPTAALLAGMAPLVGLAYPMSFVADRASALHWLGWTERLDALAAVDEAARIAGEARGQPPVVHDLRGWLERSLIGASLDAAAAALAMSARSLQRELREAGTCFTAEIHAARVRVACELLGDTDDKIEVIARAVGSTSASQLSTIFRRHLGLTPARYRAALARKARLIDRESIAG